MPQRAYGYTSDYELIPEEVAILREARDRIVAGESLAAIIADFNNRKLPSVREGGIWRRTVLVGRLRHPRVVGLHTRRDGTLVPGPHPPIFTTEEHDEVIAALNTRRGPGIISNAPKSLLTGGLLRCGVCGHSMVATMQGAGRARTYRCPSTQGGCGGVKVQQAMVDADIESEILLRLASPEVMAPVVAQAKRSTATKLAAERDGLRAKLAELGEAYAAGAVDLATVEAATAASKDRLAELEAGVPASEMVLKLPKPNLSAVARWWTEAEMERRTATVRVFIDRVVVSPGRRGPRKSAMDRLTIHWREA